jgi:hypothetical protein
MSPNAGGERGVAGSQPMSGAVHRSPNKLWRSNSIFNLCRRSCNSRRLEAHSGGGWQAVKLMLRADRSGRMAVELIGLPR